MRFKNHFLQTRVTFLSHLSPPSNLRKAIYFSSCQTSSSDWARHNQLFQRHPKFRLLEEQCQKKPHLLQHLVSYVFVSGLHRNAFVISRLLYVSLIDPGANPELGVRIFHSTENPNIFSWNTAIRFFAGSDPPTSLRYYVEMLRRDSFPDRYTFTFLLQACGAVFDLGLVQQVHSHVLKLVPAQCSFVANSLLGAHLACGSELDARLVFDEMPERDVVTWTCMISGLVSLSNFVGAFLTFRDLILDNSQTRPNPITIISTMSACAGLGCTNLTKCMHSYLEKSGWLELNPSIVNSLMDAYAKCGDVCYFRKVFDSIRISERDLYSWTSIISGYAMLGLGPEALDMFLQMEKERKFIPDSVTFVAVLSGCAHSGLVKEGLLVFESMVTKYKIKPDLKHYGCVVDLLARVGLLKRAYGIVESMPMEPNLVVLGSLLNGCRLHNNLEMGRDVSRKIETLSERGGARVLLSNMYANERQWGEVMSIRKEAREMMTKKKGKPPGRSWIEIKDEVHEFVARNRSDSEAMELHVVLEGLEKLSRL
ncbi:pentatricopeptide repeat (PPR) superfamily protein [Striga asiatica]|uniref:Pentatricopeptide repeat (PPR) superfamily protein n=1 Tax=Striga asiatica TaxID=4170 RepID=A0A5A7QQ84_STRAF|nr:pentatricopeptide repeat (PPR) superfamily protein [Striga asiatica]